MLTPSKSHVLCCCNLHVSAICHTRLLRLRLSKHCIVSGLACEIYFLMIIGLQLAPRSKLTCSLIDADWAVIG